MTKGFFRTLFYCTKNNIQLIFKNYKLRTKITGFSFFSAPTQKVRAGCLFVIISRKVGKACQRNKLRRRLKALFYQGKLYQKPFDTVLICYPSAADRTFLELQQILVKHFS